MTLSVTFRRAARIEFLAAAERFEAQRPILGVQFIAEIERCVSIAAEKPHAYAVVRQDIRRVTARRFPYSIYYRAEQSRIVVLAVFHGSRDPAIWQGRA